MPFLDKTFNFSKKVFSFVRKTLKISEKLGYLFKKLRPCPARAALEISVARPVQARGPGWAKNLGP